MENVTVPKWFYQIVIGAAVSLGLWNLNQLVNEIKTNTSEQKVSSAALLNLNAQVKSVTNNQERQYKAQEKANDKIHKMEVNNKVTNAQLDAYWKQANAINSKLAEQGERMAVILRDLKNHSHHER